MHGSPPASFATFWQGPVDPITYTCMASFPALGLDLCVYAYAQELALPPGVALADARQIVADTSLTERFRFQGAPSIAKFSNLFRYRLIRDTQCCWIDGDMLCLRAPDFRIGHPVLGWQGDADDLHAINTAVLMLPDGPVLQALTAGAETSLDQDQPWGSTGPELVTRLAKEHGLAAFAAPRSAFYPVPWPSFYMPFLPAFREEVEAATAGSTFVHLWNAQLTRAGYDRTACPPEGSYFHDACRRLGTLDRFDRVYGEAEAVQLLQPAMGGPPL